LYDLLPHLQQHITSIHHQFIVRQGGFNKPLLQNVSLVIISHEYQEYFLGVKAAGA
jgi:hypothetical protein